MRRKEMAKKFLLLMLGLTIICWLLKVSDFQMVAASLKSSHKGLLAMALGLQMVTMIMIALQWTTLGAVLGKKVSAKTMLYINLAGSFWESITPAAKAGGEAVKVVMLKKEFDQSYSDAVSLVGLQKAVSMITFFAFSAGSVLWFFISGYSFFQYTSLVMAGMIFPLAVMALLFFMARRGDALTSWCSCLPVLAKKREVVAAGFLALSQNISRLTHRKKDLGKQFVFGLAIWFLFPLKAWMAAKGLGVEIGFIPLAVITFIAYSVAMLPLTPGGLGTFEATMTVLLSQMGVVFGEALLLALGIRFITFWFVFLISACSLFISQMYPITNPR